MSTDATNQLGIVSPPFQWFGGKSEMAGWIWSEIRAIPGIDKIVTFVDTHGGAGSVLLANTKPFPVEVYNDIDGELVNFFRVCRETPNELAVRLELTPYSREEYEMCRAGLTQDYASADWIEQARRFATVARMSMSGACGRSWSSVVIHSRRGMASGNSRWLHLPQAVIDVGQRFRTVQIEHMDAAKLVTRYDRPTTLFYLDPPYHPDVRQKDVYRYEMDAEAHEELLTILPGIQGAAVVSGYTHPLYEEKLRAWRRAERVVPCRSNVNSKGGTSDRPTRTEVLWIKEAMP